MRLASDSICSLLSGAAPQPKSRIEVKSYLDTTGALAR
jgi:hypothetical protein